MMLDEKDLQEIRNMIQESEVRMIAEFTNQIGVLKESYFQPQFNLLAENQQLIMEMITPKSEIEELRGEIDILKMVIRTMSADIAELKAAQ